MLPDFSGDFQPLADLFANNTFLVSTTAPSTATVSGSTSEVNLDAEVSAPNVPTSSESNVTKLLSGFSSLANNTSDWRGLLVQSKADKKEAVIYAIPGTSKCYKFQWMRDNKHTSVYRCCACKSVKNVNGKRSEYYTKVEVQHDRFLEDPLSLSHQCETMELVSTISKVLLLLKAKEVRENRIAETVAPRAHWESVLMEIEKSSILSKAQKDSLTQSLYYKGPEHSRRVFSRAVNSHKDKEITMKSVTTEDVKLTNDESFLQLKDEDVHMYYDPSTLQRAVDCGLTAFIADGSFSHQPQELGRSAQVYTVHGSCDGDVYVPLFFCITSKRTISVYETIFKTIIGAFKKLNFDCTSLTIVTDFEAATIHVTQKLFADAQGCSFHWSQAIHRKHHQLGLRKFSDEKVLSWWKQVKGTMFLPRELLSHVNALQSPPVPPKHPAYLPCGEFLEYFRKEWLQSVKKNLWCKWLIHTNRSSNLAEAYHRRISVSSTKDHPPLSRLIERFQLENIVSKAELQRQLDDVQSAKRKKTQDIERRAKVFSNMNEFKKIMEQRIPTHQEIVNYIECMAECVSAKVTK